jgi:hypothetical protein
MAKEEARWIMRQMGCNLTCKREDEETRWLRLKKEDGRIRRKMSCDG